MNFELQNLKQEVSKKADQWKVDSLNSEVSELKNKCNNLQSQLLQANSSLQNYYSAFEQLCNMMLEHEVFSEHQDQIHQIKQYL